MELLYELISSFIVLCASGLMFFIGWKYHVRDASVTTDGDELLSFVCTASGFLLLLVSVVMAFIVYCC